MRFATLITSYEQAGIPMEEDSENLFQMQQHPISNRYAIIEDDGRCAWLYLTEPGSQAPAAGCWLYNRLEAPEALDDASIAKGLPPMAPASHMKDPRPVEPPNPYTVWFRWTADGESVAVISGSPPDMLGYILAGRRRGRSTGLKGSSPFGSGVDWDEFEEVFKMVL
jgi:hypothetical protein